MTPKDRVIAALSHQEPDRVPTGENQVDGAIVERNFTTQRTLRLGEQGPTYAGGVALPWALVQTNWDWDKPEPAQDPRRATAGKTKRLKIRGALPFLYRRAFPPKGLSCRREWFETGRGMDYYCEG